VWMVHSINYLKQPADIFKILELGNSPEPVLSTSYMSRRASCRCQFNISRKRAIANFLVGNGSWEDTYDSHSHLKLWRQE
jgi:hypothetical protein